MSQQPFSSDGGFVTAGDITVSGVASPAPSINGFSSVNSNNISLSSGHINGGTATVVNDGINSIQLAPGAQMDVFAFPFSGGTARGQLTISGVTTPAEVNGTWYYQSVSTNAYQIYTDSTYSTLVNASGWSAYTGGGVVEISKQTPPANIVVNSNGYFSTFTNAGQLDLPGSLTAVGDIGTDGNVYANSFIGNGAALTGITVSGSAPVSTTGNVEAGNLTTTGTVSANNIGNIAALNLNGNASTVLYGNGVFAAVAGGGTYGNSNVNTLLAAWGSNTVSTTGNITSGYLFGNGSQLTGIVSSYGNANVATLLSAFGSNTVSTTGTVYAGNTSTSGNATIGTALQIIGSTNTIQTTNGSAVQFANRVNFNAAGSSIVASGNISGANILGSTLSVSGNVTGNYILGNAALMTGIPASYGNANLANIGANSISTTGNISAGYLLGNASQLTGLPATYGNANVAAYLPTYSGNLNAGNIISSGNANINLDPAGTGIVAIIGSASATGNIVTAGNFVGNGAALTNVTVSVAGNVVGTQPNVNIVAGSYTYTFDNTGNVTLPTGGDLVFSANTTLTSVGGTNGNITINPDGTGQLVVTNITPAYFGNSVAITGPIRTGNGSYANNPGNGDIVFNNGGIDTPGVTFYYGNNTNFGIDSYSGNTITTPNYLRIVKNLNEAGAAELIKIDQGGNISFAGSAMSIFTTQRKFDWTAMIHGNPATGGSITGSLLGNASYTNVSDGVTLTPNTAGQSGSVAWNTTTFDFTKDFVMEWSWFTSTGGVNPADGVWATFGGNTNGGAASPAGTTNGSIGLRYQTFTNLKTQWYSNGATTGNAVAFRAGVTYQGEWQTSRIMVRTVSNTRYAYVYTGVGGVCDNAIDVTSWTPAGTWIAVGASTGSATSGQLCCHVALEYL